MARGSAVVKVIGSRKLKRVMEGLPKKIQSKILRTGLRKAIKLVADRVRTLVPRDTGQLRKSIKVRAGKRKRNRISITAQTGEGFFKGKTYYGGFQEYGTEKMQAEPFLRPAFDQRERPAAEILETEIKKLAKEAWKENK